MRALTLRKHGSMNFQFFQTRGENFVDFSVWQNNADTKFTRSFLLFLHMSFYASIPFF
jgi:hypothetical protein